jgi:hypothetical protein
MINYEKQVAIDVLETTEKAKVGSLEMDWTGRLYVYHGGWH